MRAAILFALTACGAATELDGKDAAPEASTTPIEAGPPPFCESLTLRPLFCDDFDDGTLAKWTTSGSVTVSAEVSHSPPFAMRASIPDGPASATIVKSFPDLTGSMHVMLSFSMLASAECFAESTQLENLTVTHLVAGPGNMLPLEVALELSGTFSALFFEPAQHGAGAVRSFTTRQVAPVPEDGAWQRVVIDLDLRGDAPHISVVTPSGTTTIPTSAIPNELDRPIITLGALANDGTHTTSCSVLFDDVIFDAR